jgi:hypothetical protein
MMKARSRSLLPLGVIGLAAAAIGSCASAPGGGEAASPGDGAEERSSAYVPLPDPERPPIGYFLVDFDARLRWWSSKRLEARTEKDWLQIESVEQQMWQDAWKRKDELIEVLQTGPPRNREVAAAALGFTRDREVLGPLLNALSDVRQEVIQKALLGLGVLADPATPLAQPLYLLGGSHDAWTRNNAAYAISRVVGAGGRDDLLAEACRDALRDDEAGVRVQCANILGTLLDPDSIEPLAVLLEDERSTVCLASASSLRRIGQEDSDSTAVVARLLVDGLARVERGHRNILIDELVRLRGKDLGRSIDPWREWAYQLR